MFYNNADWRLFIDIKIDGEPADLTDKEIRMSWRNDFGAGMLEATSGNGMLRVPDPMTGRIEILVPWATTKTLPFGRYSWDLVEITSADTRGHVSGGSFHVQRGVTQ